MAKIATAFNGKPGLSAIPWFTPTGWSAPFMGLQRTMRRPFRTETKRDILSVEMEVFSVW